MEGLLTLLLYAGLLSFLVIFLNFIFLWSKARKKQGYSKYHEYNIFRFCSKECIDEFDVNSLTNSTSLNYLLRF